MLKDEQDPELRRAAVYGLGNTESDDAVTVLVEVVRNDADVRVRKAAVAALGQIGTPRAQEALLEILRNQDGGNN